ncbi:MAG TPA: hypothetical protein VFM10_12730 [Terriglobales bacterium]|nr:hypothetical protein [Terriglobales bacterium]
MAKQKVTGTTGLPLPRRAVRVLRERGIFAHAIVSVEHQHLADRYVLRGLESGGSTGDIGRYVTFAGTEGQPLECLHPVESIAVNGLHAIVIVPEVVRVDMLRKDRTYELLITGHRLSAVENGTRPRLETEILFRGVHGRLELDLSRRDKVQAGKVTPSFYSFSGEQVNVPEKFMAVIRAATHGVNCIGCAHSHYVRKSSAHQFGQASSTRPESAIEVQSA